MEAVPRREGEQLDEALGLPQAPPILFYEPRANPHAKASEQANAHHLRLPTGLPTGAPGRTAVRLVVLGALCHPLPPCVCCKRKIGSPLSKEVAGCATGSARPS